MILYRIILIYLQCTYETYLQIYINMNTKSVERVKVVNWTETLRRMNVGSFLICSIEEKQLVSPKAYTFKDRTFTINKIEGTKQYKVTRTK